MVIVCGSDELELEITTCEAMRLVDVAILELEVGEPVVDVELPVLELPTMLVVPEVATLEEAPVLEIEEAVLVVVTWIEEPEDDPGYELLEICEVCKVCEVCEVSKVCEVRLEVLEESCDEIVELLGIVLGKTVVVVVNRAEVDEVIGLPVVVKVLLCAVETVVL